MTSRPRSPIENHTRLYTVEVARVETPADTAAVVRALRDWPGKVAIGGGVITYTANGAQKVAVAAGSTHLAWPTKIVTAKVVVLGLDDASASQ